MLKTRQIYETSSVTRYCINTEKFFNSQIKIFILAELESLINHYRLINTQGPQQYLWGGCKKKLLMDLNVKMLHTIS